VSGRPRVAYATAGWTVHDRRWLDALRDNDLKPVALSIAGSSADLPGDVDAVPDAEALRARIAGLADHPDGVAVLAGPLTTVTSHLVGLPIRLVGLSWGWDLQPQAIGQEFDPASLAWVAGLDGLIVDSVVTRHVATGLGLSPDRISLIPWGADTDVFTPDGPRADLGLWGVTPSDHVVLSLRSHTPIHRVGDVVEAFDIAAAEDPDLVLLVGGDGPLRAALEARVADLGLADRVRFLGMLDEARLPSLLRAVGLYVSATAVDGTSVTLLQALACGTPTVVSDIPANRPWADQAWTRTFPLGDVAALADAMVRTPYAPGGTRAPHRLPEDRRGQISWPRNSRALAGIMRPGGSRTGR
jgi:glycosyltransferase involved in cell wall biosynthesis